MAETPVTYKCFYSENVPDMVKAVNVLQFGLKQRQKILEAGIT